MRAIIIATVTTVLSIVSAAEAQSEDVDREAATHLFNEARSLMAQERYEEACRAFETSFALYAVSGTLLNLALCYEKLGKLATAWKRYGEAAALADRDGKTVRAEVAREHAAALEPRLPRLRIQLQSPGAVPGLVVRRDADPVTDRLGMSEYVDPGEHEITAAAPAHEDFSMKIRLTEAEERTLKIPALEPSEPLLPPGRPESIPKEQEPQPINKTPDTGSVTQAQKTIPTPGVPGRTRRIAAVATGVAGLATLGAGLGVGISAQSIWDEAFDNGECRRDSRACTLAGLEKTDTARTRARISDILLGVGLAATATGALLYFTAPEADRQQGQARLVPLTGPDTVGLSVTGSF